MRVERAPPCPHDPLLQSTKVSPLRLDICMGDACDGAATCSSDLTGLNARMGAHVHAYRKGVQICLQQNLASASLACPGIKNRMPVCESAQRAEIAMPPALMQEVLQLLAAGTVLAARKFTAPASKASAIEQSREQDGVEPEGAAEPFASRENQGLQLLEAGNQQSTS
eukprot:4403908-Pleurochrysis_carterae.AAC.2